MTTSSSPDDAALAELREQARVAASAAYVPYSGFRVGAAMRFRDGTVVTGCNVENASFGATVCAERTALCAAVARGMDTTTITDIAVHVDGDDGAPCGICRQFILELAPAATVTFIAGGELKRMPARDLLPAAFVPEALSR